MTTLLGSSKTISSGIRAGSDKLINPVGRPALTRRQPSYRSVRCRRRHTRGSQLVSATIVRWRNTIHTVGVVPDRRTHRFKRRGSCTPGHRFYDSYLNASQFASATTNWLHTVRLFSTSTKYRNSVLTVRRR